MNQELSPRSVVRPREGASARRMDDDMVVLDVETGRYFGLNPVGARIWDGIERGLTLSAIADTVVAEFDVSRDTCEADIVSLVRALLEQNLVTVESAPGA